MLAHRTEHRGPELQGTNEWKRSNNGGLAAAEVDPRAAIRRPLRSLAIRLLVGGLVGTIGFSCGSEPVDPRTQIPSDALIYLETRDLGAAVSAVTRNPRFQMVASRTPDLSVLNGMEVSVAITGFETSEQQLTQENSVLNFKPRFVAALETRLWNFQVISFVEEELGLFVSEAYGGAATLETSEKHGGRHFTWSSEDGRKAYALVIGSLLFFGNDDSAIEKCVAVRKGEVESIAKNAKLTAGERLAFGYVAPDGVAQLANIAGISLAKRSSEDSEIQSFVARVLPELLRNSLSEITWTSVAAEDGIEDRFAVSTNDELAAIFNETLVPGEAGIEALRAFVPADTYSVTRYDLRDPQIAWRTLVLTARRLTDEVSGQIIASFSDSLFEPYGIDNGELFLSSIGSQVLTLRFDQEGEKQVVIAEIRKMDDLKRSVAAELGVFKPASQEAGASIWRSTDGDVTMAIMNDRLILGDPDSVARCLAAYRAGQPEQAGQTDWLAASNAVASTIGSDHQIAVRIADAVSDRKSPDISAASNFTTETRFNRNGIERRTISDFGLIGTLIAQFAPESTP